MRFRRRIYLTGASLVLPNEVVQEGSLLMEDGLITRICPVSAAADQTVDLKGCYLLPGLVDLHGDAIESYAEPRPGILFPFRQAVALADRVAALVGITTPFHALSFAGRELGLRNNHQAAALARCIVDYAPHALVDNRVHCRYEITDPQAPAIIGELIESGVCSLLSCMDHTPGQGQYPTFESYRDYLVSKYKEDSQQISEHLSSKGRARSDAWIRVAPLIKQAGQAGIPVASHDDDSPEKITRFAKRGVTISEFPMNLETAQAVSARGMHALVGSTNIVRGGSQLRGMAALELIAEGYADCLCSDYVPATLLSAVLLISDRLSIPLHQSARLATANPAQAAGLTDRGRLAEGLRADLIAVRAIDAEPQVVHAWVGGRPVLAALYPVEGSNPDFSGRRRSV